MARSKQTSLLGNFAVSTPAFIPARTPGPTGWNDAGDPNVTTLLGDTGGPLGYGDYADPALFWSRGSFESQFSLGGQALALSLGSKEDPSAVLTYPGTRFRYQRTKRTLDSCLETLPVGLRQEFRNEIEAIIKGMHELGFALGVLDKAKAGYRTFDDQNGLGREATRAGPGESFHNYLCAVDLGFLQWVDEDGKARSDFWLGLMDGIPKYKGFSALLWEKRNGFSDAVHSLDWEIIHLQSVPADASGREMLVKCLNKAAAEAGDAKWRYRRHGREQYQCTMGSDSQWTIAGTAKQMWEQSSPQCEAEDRQTLRKHMAAAETIAKTIDVG